MTQKGLGLKAGFLGSTADVRIRQYESGKMIPKEDKLNDIAKALDVDVSALADHNIESDSDVIHIFFEKLIKLGFDIEIVSAPERSGPGHFVCPASFKSSQILDAREEKAIAFAEYHYVNYFYSSMLSTALNHVVRDMIEKYKTGEFDDDLYQLLYQDSFQIFNVPVEDAR